MQIPIQPSKPCSDNMKMSIQTDSETSESEQDNSQEWKFIASFLDKLCFSCFAVIEMMLFFLTCFKNF